MKEDQSGPDTFFWVVFGLGVLVVVTVIAMASPPGTTREERDQMRIDRAAAEEAREDSVLRAQLTKRPYEGKWYDTGGSAAGVVLRWSGPTRMAEFEVSCQWSPARNGYVGSLDHPLTDNIGPRDNVSVRLAVDGESRGLRKATEGGGSFNMDAADVAALRGGSRLKVEVESSDEKFAAEFSLEGSSGALASLRGCTTAHRDRMRAKKRAEERRAQVARERANDPCKWVFEKGRLAMGGWFVTTGTGRVMMIDQLRTLPGMDPAAYDQVKTALDRSGRSYVRFSELDPIGCIGK